MSNSNHPWRRGRSGRFAEYLKTLPPEEAQRIARAERTFVYKTAFVTAPPVLRDYAESMVGIA